MEQNGTLMNKSQLAEAVARIHSLSKTEAAAIVSTVVDTIHETVASGEEVAIFGHGTYRCDHRKARTARNPGTGDPVEVPAKYVPVFAPGSVFKGAVAQGRAG